MLPEFIPTKASKLKLKDILEKHDINAFRDFCMDEAELDVARWPREKLSALMHTLKSKQIHFGDLAQESRNFLREEAVTAKPGLWTQDLKDYYSDNAHYPLCNSCKWFREAPEGESSCTAMGAMPLDVACPGWSKPVQKQV